MLTPLRVLSALSLLTLVGSASAQICPTVTKLDNGASAAANDNFGLAIAMSFGGLNDAPLLAVGQPNEDAPVAGENAGGFTVYHKPFGSWVQMYNQWNSTGQGGEQLGFSISLADPYLIAGAPGYNTNEGRARIYRRPSNGSGYTGAVDVLPNFGGANSGFGRAVAISAYGGGWAVVGAPTHSRLGVDSGAVFFYTRDDANNTWNQDFEIWGADYLGRAYDHRGAAVSMAQDTEFCAIGSPDRELTGQPTDHGTVMIVYRLANGFVSGQPDDEVAPPSPEQGEHFGSAVSIEGHLLVVGSPDEDMTLQEGGFTQQAIDGGAMYIFERNAQTHSWDFVAKFRSPNPVNGGHFGDKVATDGNRHIVVSEAATGRAYLFVRNGTEWSYQAAFGDPDSPSQGSFGSAVAVRGDDVAVGDAYDDNNNASNAGAVYVMSMSADAVLGDLCTNPIEIPAGDYVGCTEYATPSPGAADITTCGNGGLGQGNDVWFEFTPSCDGNAIFDTYGSQFDTVLSVHSTCPVGLGGDTTIVCNDDASFPAPNNRASLVTFNFTANTTYLVRVTGYSRAAGQFTLRHLYTWATTNDLCVNATQVNFGTFEFNSACATTDTTLPSSCAGPSTWINKDVWYRFTAPQGGLVKVDTCGSQFDTVLAVYAGPGCPSSPAAQIACNDDSTDLCTPGVSRQSSLTFTAVLNQAYYVRVGGFSQYEGGLGQVSIQPYLCRADFNHDGVVNSQDFFDFLTAFFSQAISADVNHDAVINSQDYFDFLTSFFAGC